MNYTLIFSMDVFSWMFCSSSEDEDIVKAFLWGQLWRVQRRVNNCNPTYTPCSYSAALIAPYLYCTCSPGLYKRLILKKGKVDGNANRTRRLHSNVLQTNFTHGFDGAACPSHVTCASSWSRALPGNIIERAWKHWDGSHARNSHEYATGIGHQDSLSIHCQNVCVKLALICRCASDVWSLLFWMNGRELWTWRQLYEHFRMNTSSCHDL